ncbi:MAG: cupin domain-containing protein, partial [Crenarchaeota archaeon]|nr:cupin domain-containing protein [Thermoproteota archaeon]
MDIWIGPCGEKIGHYEIIEEQKVPDEMGTKTYVRWLIKEDDGARAFAMRLFTIKPGGH